MSGKFPIYNLSAKQIKGIANIVLHEQGTIAGWYAEASQIANRTDIKGDSYATAANAVRTVTSGWYAKGKSRYSAGTNNKEVIDIVKRVFCDGYRTLPRYIDEHDCISDISTVKTGTLSVKADKSKWQQHKTIIKNKMGSTYTFYSFPGGYKTGVDPFGYTSKAYRDKWGDFCYTLEQAKRGDVAKPTAERIVTLLGIYHAYVVAHSKYFINQYDGSLISFAKTRAKVDTKKTVGITCVVPLRWALYEMGVIGAGGKSLISAPGGSFAKYYSGDVKTYFSRTTKGGAVGKTIREAIDGKLLKAGDIICFQKLTHTAVYSGSRYMFYEGGGSCVINEHYPNGIKLDYGKGYYSTKKIAEVLRVKSESATVPKTGTIKKTADILLTQARSWIGCKESDGSHKKIIDLYNAYKPLPRGYVVKYTDAWCATFVSACAIACGYLDIIPRECSCQQMIEIAKKWGIWIENENRTPAPGELILYDWQDSGSGDNKGNPDHIGIVEKVENGKITVIEGNYNDAVGRRTIAVNGKGIRGYISPKYGQVQTPAQQEKAKKGYTDTFPALPPRGWYRHGDGMTTYLSYRKHIKNLQKLINWIAGTSLSINGKYGNKTEDAVRKAQKIMGIKQDGLFGHDTLAKARAYKK